MEGDWLESVARAFELGEILLAPVVWWLWRLGQRVGECERQLALQAQRLDQWDRETREARGRIGESIERVSMEIGMLRTESSEQHRALRDEMVGLSNSGTASREKLHERINELTRSVDRMLGEKGSAR